MNFLTCFDGNEWAQKSVFFSMGVSASSMADLQEICAQEYARSTASWSSETGAFKFRELSPQEKVKFNSRN